MFDWAARGVAMANAHPELKAVADEVTLSNEDDGIAVVLERLFPCRTDRFRESGEPRSPRQPSESPRPHQPHQLRQSYQPYRPNQPYQSHQSYQ
jgi:hypothetical protein